MRLDSYLLLAAGAAGSLLGLAALVTGVQGIAAVLCALVFGAAATCLYVGWRFWTDSPLTRYRQRCHVAIPASHAGNG
ncbi:MAG: hypothetical protein EHM59_17360 [Betaproteobacteria bacterium]|nr:MAG: hypothetical protein EHM59_17360 [Betaproteobacteria bacterium]